jgi:hypothetical protein
MRIEQRIRHKTLRTHRTSVRPLGAVSTFHVHHQRAPLRVLLAANLARVRLLLGVHPQMHIQDLFLDESPSAVTTPERLLPGVSLHVIPQTLQGGDSFSAYLAQMSLPLVHLLHVTSQSLVRAQHAVAHLASELLRFVSTVVLRYLVSFEALRVRQQFIAHFASKLLAEVLLTVVQVRL